MKNYRYPGTQSFTPHQKLLFFGRKDDNEQLLDYLKIFDHLVLHSKSGLGKSSLLNAGLLPKLVTIAPTYIFNFRGYDKDNPLNIIEFITEKLNPKLGEHKSQASEEKINIWFELKRIQLKTKSKTIYLIFDQFEQLFTYPTKSIQEFTEELSEAFHFNIPKKYREQLDYYIKDNENSLAPEDIELLYQKLELKLLFSIRSDKLNLLDRLSDYFPSILKNTLELSPFTRRRAEEAIVLPAAEKKGNYESHKYGYSSKCLDEIINFLTKDDTRPIEPFQLQVICEDIEKNIICKDEQQQKEIIRTADLPDLKNLFEDYYQKKIIENFDPHHQKLVSSFIEDKLIAEGSIRIPCHLEVAKKYFLEHGISDDEIETIINKFDNFRILRIDPYGDSYIYELSHDSLIEPIQKAKEKREEKERIAKQEEETRNQLIEAKKRLAEEEEKRKDEEEKRKIENKLKQRYKVSSIIIGILSIGGVILLAQAIATEKEVKTKNIQLNQTLDSLEIEKEKALAQEKRALKEKNRSDSLKNIALINEENAKIARIEAEDAKSIADDERDRANLERDRANSEKARAENSKTEAENQKQLAQIESYKNLSISNAFKSLQEETPEKKAALALSAWYLNLDYGDTVYNSTIFESMYNAQISNYPIKAERINTGRIESYFIGKTDYYIISDIGMIYKIDREKENFIDTIGLHPTFQYYNLSGDLSFDNSFLALSFITTKQIEKKPYGIQIIDLSSTTESEIQDSVLVWSGERISKIRALNQGWIYLRKGKLFSYKNEKEELKPINEKGYIMDFTISNDRLLFITRSGDCYRYTMQPLMEEKRISHFMISPNDEITILKSKDIETIAAGTKNGHIYLYDALNNVRSVHNHESSIKHLQFFQTNADEWYLLSGDVSGKLNLIPIKEFQNSSPFTLQGDSWIAGVDYNDQTEKLILVYKNQTIERHVVDQELLAVNLCKALNFETEDTYIDHEQDSIVQRGCKQQIISMQHED